MLSLIYIVLSGYLPFHDFEYTMVELYHKDILNLKLQEAVFY